MTLLLRTYCLSSLWLASVLLEKIDEVELGGQFTYTKDKLISPSILAFNSSSRLRFKPTTNFTGFVSFVFALLAAVAVVADRRGRNGAGASGKFGAKELLGFLLRRRRRPLEGDPALDENSDSSSLRRRSSMIASFDMSFERSEGIVVVVEDSSFAGIVIGESKL